MALLQPSAGRMPVRVAQTAAFSAAALWAITLLNVTVAGEGTAFRSVSHDGWTQAGSAQRGVEPRRFEQHAAQAIATTKTSELKWRPVGAAKPALRSTEIVQTAGESEAGSHSTTFDRYGRGGSSVRRNPVRTAQSNATTRLGAQDPFENDAPATTAPQLSVPSDAPQAETTLEDAFPPADSPTPLKKADPFEDDFTPRAAAPESESPLPKQASPFDQPEEATQPMPEMRFQPAPRKLPPPPTRDNIREPMPSPSDRSDEARAQTEEVDCEAGRRIVQAGGLDGISLNLRQRGKAGQQYPDECPLWDEMFADRCWAETTYEWKASALCHKPLYFEDVQLERYGHEWGPIAQPVISAAHFFATIPILPYKMGLETPDECVYALGYYRPNSCAPYMIEPIGFTWRAALFEAGAAVGTVAVLP